MALVMMGVLVLPAAGCAARETDVRPDSPPPTATPTSTTAAVPVRPARRAKSVIAAEPPVLIGLASGRQVAVRSVGTTAAGLLEVPDDIRQAGWWRGGARVGDPFGSILLAAHVDSRTQGLGPFAELLTVAPGARLRLSSEHLVQAYEVQSRQLVPQGSLVRQGWLFEASGRHRLTLVTCAPPYDSSRGGYQNLAVVTAVPVSPVGRP